MKQTTRLHGFFHAVVMFHTTGWKKPCALTLVMLCVGVSGSAFADDVDRVRQLRSTDSILPLSNILSRIEPRYPGTLLDVELEDEKGVIFYEIELLGPDHMIRIIKVDARSGQIIAPEQN